MGLEWGGVPVVARGGVLRLWFGLLRWAAVGSLCGAVGCASVRGDGRGDARTRPTDWPLPAPAGDLIYFVLVDRFANGAPDAPGSVNPADPHAWHGGDLQGLRARLPWLDALGVGSVWTSPLTLGRRATFMGHGAYHGYWMLDPREADPALGGKAAARALADALHRRGHRLLLDTVLNHLSYEAPLTRSHPQWFHHRGPIKDWQDPQELIEGEVHGLPDLAVERPQVAAFLETALRGWIDAVHPDGLRLDAVKHLPEAFWARLSRSLHKRYGPRFYLLGEDLEGDPLALSRRWRATGFDAVFDFPLRYALIDVACKDAPLTRLAALLSLDRLYARPEALVTLLDNHDLPRLQTECGRDPARVRLALQLLFALRGTPSLLYGTEVGLEGLREEQARGDMRFDAAAPEYALIAGLARRRRRHPALQQGRTRVLALSSRRLLLLRAGGHELLLLGVNLEAAPGVIVQARLRELLEPALDARALASLRVQAIDEEWPGPTPHLEAEGPGPGDASAEALRLPARGVRVWSLLTGAAADRVAARFAREGSLERPAGSREVAVSLQLPVAPVVALTPAGRPGPAAGLAAGDRLLLVGSDPALGGWKTQHAPALACDARGLCKGRLRLPVGSVVEWKAVIERPGEGQGAATLRWQEGANRVLWVRRQGPAPAIRGRF